MRRATYPILLLLLGLFVQPARADEERLRQARIHLEAQDALRALQVLEPLIKGRHANAEALVLHSEAQVQVGNVRDAFEDLERALEIDPTIRQGWLNLAGLEIAQSNFDEAYAALEKARQLDPSADDNDLNLGAIQALRGKKVEAKRHFDAYLERQKGSAEAHYLVAANYALAGWANLSVAALERAFRLDESIRLRARSDDRFLILDSSPAYRELLQRDFWTPPPGYRTNAAAFSKPWNPADPALLYAFLDAMKEQGLRWDPTIETSPTWAIVRGPLRAKIATQTNGTGVITLSAPPDRWSATDWQKLTQSIFRAVWHRVQNAPED